MRRSPPPRWYWGVLLEAAEMRHAAPLRLGTYAARNYAEWQTPSWKNPSGAAEENVAAEISARQNDRGEIPWGRAPTWS